MNLYLISQTQNCDYDTYDSAVVAAPDEETARGMQPSEVPHTWEALDCCIAGWRPRGWVDSPEHVTVRYLGEAAPGVSQGVICASFNAG